MSERAWARIVLGQAVVLAVLLGCALVKRL
jgi:hypothetical protein